MKTRNLVMAAVLSLAALPAAAAEQVKIAIGGASCLCYLPTVLADQLGLFEKHGIDAELIDFKGGSQALKAVVGGSADVVSGYYEHTINLAAKKQQLSAFVVYDRFPGIVVVVAPDETQNIKSIADLAGKTVATQAGSTGETLLETEAPDADVLALPDHAQALESVVNGNADAYVIDQTLLLNAVLQQEGAVKIVGEPFGPVDLYGIGVLKGSDATEFVNTFLQQIIDDGLWAELWTVTIGDRTGVTEVPAPPTVGETGLS